MKMNTPKKYVGKKKDQSRKKIRKHTYIHKYTKHLTKKKLKCIINT